MANPSVKEKLSSAMGNLLDTVPLASATLSNTLVVANSWIVEFANEDAAAAQANVNKLKHLMLSGDAAE